MTKEAKRLHKKGTVTCGICKHECSPNQGEYIVGPFHDAIYRCYECALAKCRIIDEDKKLKGEGQGYGLF